jgi:hypothetical protein
MARLRVAWTGLTALPGLSTFYSSNTLGSLSSDVVTFFGNVSDNFPAGLTWDVPSNGDVIEVETGTLTGTWGVPGSSQVNAQGGAEPYAAGVGVQVQWTTGAVVNGRRVRGSTFLCPLITASYDTSGTITSGVITDVSNAASILLAAEPIGIWHRPTGAGADGYLATVESAVVPDRITALRSRRY